MKKIISVVILLVLIMGMTNVCFAAPDTVEAAEYSQQNAAIIEVPNDTIPKAPASDGAVNLPKTGGIPAETFYVFGAIIILTALVISFKKPKIRQQ